MTTISEELEQLKEEAKEEVRVLDLLTEECPTDVKYERYSCALASIMDGMESACDLLHEADSPATVASVVEVLDWLGVLFETLYSERTSLV